MNALSAAPLVIASCLSAQDDRLALLRDPNLSGWTVELGPRHPALASEDLAPAAAFSVTELDGEPVLRVQGALWGALVSDEIYRDFHLRIEYRWGDAVWPPLGFRDAGVMYHSVGAPRSVSTGASPATGPGPLSSEPGVDGFFRESMEYQIARGNVGGYASLGRVVVTPGETLPHLERRIGAWNRIDILTVGNASAHLLNGHVVSRQDEARYRVGAMETRLDAGHLQIQSEGAEILFRRASLRPIRDLDAELEALRLEIERPPREVPTPLTEEWLDLFNGVDLAGWSAHVGPPGAALAETDAEPDPVFTVVEEDGAPAIRVTGAPWGSLATDLAFENFHLVLDFKWGDTVWPDEQRDSGVVYHSFGAPGLVALPATRAYGPGPLRRETGWGGAFMQGIECEIAPGLTGLFRSLGNVAVAYTSHRRPQPLPPGVWNRLEILCHGDRAVHVLNDQRLCRVEESKRVHGQEEIALTSGRIQLQSKGAEIFFRNLQIRRLDALR